MITNVILASKSPRRQQLIGQLFPNYVIRSEDIEEYSAFVRPHKKVMDLAAKKAHVYTADVNELIISADTLVYMKGVYYGKPKGEAGAIDMLSRLSGKTHTVYTGVCLKSFEKEKLFYDKSYVTFRKLSRDEIVSYLRTYMPYDKAGAYGLQDKQIVQSYKGSYTNIIGLPMEKLKKYIEELGVKNEQ